jgi:DNA-binding GntR family transcriptional regulator
MIFQTKTDVAYERLRERIMNGSLPPGTTLKQEQLALEFGLSTTPLREAIRRLESEGLVTTSAHREVLVSQVALADLLAVYEVRENLDPVAASLAASRRSNDEAQQITSLAKGIAIGSTEDALMANRKFHTAIYRASHNPILIDVLDNLWDRSDRHRRLIGDLAHSANVTGEHIELAQAILRQDARLAGSLMRAHVRNAKRLAQHGLDESSGHNR